MGTIVTVLAIIGFLVLFAYLKLPPRYADPKLVMVYNTMVLAVCGVLCLVWFLKVRSGWADADNDPLWKPIAIGGALVIESVFLGVCFLLRNFWIFRPPRHPGSFGF